VGGQLKGRKRVRYTRADRKGPEKCLEYTLDGGEGAQATRQSGQREGTKKSHREEKTKELEKGDRRFSLSREKKSSPGRTGSIAFKKKDAVPTDVGNEGKKIVFCKGRKKASARFWVAASERVISEVEFALVKKSSPEERLSIGRKQTTRAGEGAIKEFPRQSRREREKGLCARGGQGKKRDSTRREKADSQRGGDYGEALRTVNDR